VFSGAGKNIMGGSTTARSGMADVDQFNQTVKTIGSIRNRQYNYSPSHTFFSGKHIKEAAATVKPMVIQEIDKDTLGL